MAGCMYARMPDKPASVLHSLGLAMCLPSSMQHSTCPQTLTAAPAARGQARARERGVAHCRLRIRDFDPFDLRLRLPEAVALVAAQARGGTVYIHCTAGGATASLTGPLLVCPRKRRFSSKIEWAQHACSLLLTGR